MLVILTWCLLNINAITNKMENCVQWLKFMIYQLKVYLKIRDSQLMSVIFRCEHNRKRKNFIIRPLCSCIMRVLGVEDKGSHMTSSGISLIWPEVSRILLFMDLGIEAMEFIIQYICSVLNPSHLLLRLYIVPSLWIISSEWLFSYLWSEFSGSAL